MKNDVIADALDLAPLQAMPVPQKYEEGQVNDDFEYARGNMIAAIEKGQEALSFSMLLVCHNIHELMRLQPHS